MSITTIILDLDGTLIDANTLHRQSFEWAVSQVSDFKMTLGNSLLYISLMCITLFNVDIPSN